MKFSAIARGTRATRRASYKFYDTEVEVAVRPLTGAEYGTVLADAAEYARSKKATRAEPGDPIYDLGVMAHTLAIGVVESDGITPHFDTGAEGILKDLNVETIAYLHEQQEAWQDEVSPYMHKLGPDELVQKVREVTGPRGQESFFALSPALRLILFRSLAERFLTSLMPSSSGTSTPERETSPKTTTDE